MGVQTVYRDAPAFGLAGQITDIANAKTTYNAPAQEDIPVARVLIKGDDIGSITQSSVNMEGYKVRLPEIGNVGTDFLGVSVRVRNIPGNPPNAQDGVPYYPADSPVTYLSQGALWVIAEADIDVSLKPVQVVVDATNAQALPLGALSPTAEALKVVIWPGAFFAKKTKSGDIVKIIVNNTFYGT